MHAYGLLVLLAAAGTTPPDARTGAPYFALPKGGSLEAFPLEESRTRFAVAGVIARVQVTQVSRNRGGEPIEATYVFPASTRAAVSGLRMRIGERTVEAKIERRAEARASYEAAREGGQGAALLEQHRANVLQMSVANILPGDRVEVELDYTELLVPEDGVYELVHPAVVGPRYTGEAKAVEAWTANPHLASAAPYSWSIAGRIDAGLPVSGVRSGSHVISPRFTDTHALEVVVDDERGGDRDFILRWRLGGERLETGLLLHRGAEAGYFALLVAPPERAAPAAVVPREYVFVVDVSGSMYGFPLETAKALMRSLLGRLRPEDRFNLMLFSGGRTVLAPASLPATEESLARALAVLDGARGGGSTELLQALEAAAKLPRSPGMATALVLVTDGYVPVEREAFALVRRELGRASLFTFGIGPAVNRGLIEGLARAGFGEPFVVTDAADAALEAERFARYVEAPLLTRVQVRFEGGFEAFEVEPPAVPDLYASRPLVVFGKYRGAPRGRVVVTGSTAQGRFERVVEVGLATPSDDLTALRLLWARHRIARLADEEALAADGELAAAITQLGLEHGLLTAHTSFVAVDSIARAQGGRPAEVRQPLPLPRGVSERALSGGGLLGTFGRGAGGGGGGDVTRSMSFGAPGLGAEAPRVATGSPSVHGSISAGALGVVIRAARGRIRYAYEKALRKDPSVGGRLVVRLTIDGAGEVAAAEIAESTLSHPELEAELLAIFRRLRFPNPGGGTLTLSYPLVLSPG